MAFGLLIGSVIYLGHALDSPDYSASRAPGLLGIAGGAAFGWLVDRTGPWQTVYP